MRRLLLIGAAVTAAAAAACDRAPTTPVSSPSAPAASLVWDGGPDKPVTVMTRNLYLGADLATLYGATTPQAMIAAATQAWGMVQANDFPARAGRIAAEIAATGPQLVGLEEVSLYRTQFPSSTMQGAPTPATDVAIDYLQLVLDSLAARGERYAAVSVATNADAQLPVMITSGPNAGQFMDVRLTDRDVILARVGLHVSNSQSGNFVAAVSYTVAGRPIVTPRGWASVDVEIRGERFRFFATHPEVEQHALVQEQQVSELLAMMDASPLPVIAVGDFNAGPGSPTYATSYDSLMTHGYTDAWTAVHGAAPGLTCCQPEYLGLAIPLYSRIDLVLTRGIPAALAADVVGEEAADRTLSGLWPSDHAGTVATLRLKPIPQMAKR